MIVHHLSVDIRQAGLRNSIALVDRKRMIGGFEFSVYLISLPRRDRQKYFNQESAAGNVGG